MSRKHGYRKDTNHDEIADAFRAIGFTWIDTPGVGDGFPDGLAIARRGHVLLVEIKVPGQDVNRFEFEFAIQHEREYVVVCSEENVQDISEAYDVGGGSLMHRRAHEITHLNSRALREQRPPRG